MKRSDVVLRSWARAGLAFGFAASLAANILSAPDTAEGRVITSMYPISMAITLEVVFRVGWSRSFLHMARLVGFVSVGAAGAVGSASHIYEVAVEHGQAPFVAGFLVLAVDGLMFVCTVTLVELGQKAKARTKPTATRPAPAPTPEPKPEPEPLGLRSVPEQDEQDGPDDLAAEARRLKDEEGLTQAEIGARIGRSERMVRRYLKETEAA